MLFVVTRNPIKAIVSVQHAGNGMQKTGVNGYNVPFVKSGFTKHVFTFINLIFNLVSDGNSAFFILLN